MAYLLAVANGNYSSSSTWATVDATSLLDVDSANGTSTALTTSMVYTTTFTGITPTIDGIAVCISSRTGTTGTMTVVLNDGSTDTRTVTINCSDLPAGKPGWVFFKFGSTITLGAGTTYKVGAKTSNTAQISLYRNATAGNWGRMLRTTTTAAPVASDTTTITGEWTAATTSTTRTVTWDIVSSATTYGKINTCHQGTFQCGTTASSAYYIKLNGNLTVYDGGTLTLGTSGTPIPSTSSLTIEFMCVSAGDFGWEIYGGNVETKHATEKTPYVLLAADASAAATSITLNTTPTNWLNTDVVCLSSTTRTAAQSESKALTADVTTTTASISAITNAHGGSAATKVQGEVGILTQKILIKGTSSTLVSYVSVAAIATAIFRNIEFTNLGTNTGLKRGIDLVTTTGSFSMQYCSLHDWTVNGATGVNINGASTNNITIANNVFYNIAGTNTSAITGAWITVVVATTGTAISIHDCMMTLTGGTTFGIYSADNGVSFYNLYLSASTATGLTLAETNQITNIHDLNIHSCSNSGFTPGNTSDGSSQASMSNLTTWRHANYGINFGSLLYNYTFDTVNCFGNGLGGMATVNMFNVLFKNCVLDAGTTLTQPVGLILNSNGVAIIEVRDSTFGATNAHATGDIQPLKGAEPSVACIVHLTNCLLASTTEVATPASLGSALLGSDNARQLSIISSQKHDQTAGNHKWWTAFGVGSIDTTFYHNASPSTRLTPTGNTARFESMKQAARVDNTKTLTFSVWVRKSVIGDGAAYNGADQPRLVLLANPSAGIASDVVLATATSASNGAWEFLSGTTASVTDDAVLEVVVDCDGTVGWVNIDDFGVV